MKTRKRNRRLPQPASIGSAFINTHAIRLAGVDQETGAFSLIFYQPGPGTDAETRVAVIGPGEAVEFGKDVVVQCDGVINNDVTFIEEANGIMTFTVDVPWTNLLTVSIAGATEKFSSPSGSVNSPFFGRVRNLP
jgi:hypothetical protein